MSQQQDQQGMVGCTGAPDLFYGGKGEGEGITEDEGEAEEVIEKVGRGRKKGREGAKGREGVKREKDKDDNDSTCKISKRKSTPKK